MYHRQSGKVTGTGIKSKTGLHSVFGGEGRDNLRQAPSRESGSECVLICRVGIRDQLGTAKWREVRGRQGRQGNPHPLSCRHKLGKTYRSSFFLLSSCLSFPLFATRVFRLHMCGL